MARLFIDPAGKKRQTTGVSLIGNQLIELRKRGGSAYLRLVLSTPVPPEHKLPKGRAK